MKSEIAAAIDAAGYAHLDDIARTVAAMSAAGQLHEDDAVELLHATAIRRQLLRATEKPAGGRSTSPRIGTIFPPKRRQRSPEKAVLVERRRRLAASGPMPPALAAKFTTAELAALKIVGDEIHKTGTCAITLDEIQARAGVSRTSAKNAIREAARLGLLHVTERRRRGQKNLPNQIDIISPEWLTWLKHGPRDRGQNARPHDQINYNRSSKASVFRTGVRPVEAIGGENVQVVHSNHPNFRRYGLT